jgi:ABC-type glycerol-3-phosphate transport system permease component
MFERFVERRAEEALADAPVVLIVAMQRWFVRGLTAGID